MDYKWKTKLNSLLVACCCCCCCWTICLLKEAESSTHSVGAHTKPIIFPAQWCVQQQQQQKLITTCGHPAGLHYCQSHSLPRAWRWCRICWRWANQSITTTIANRLQITRKWMPTTRGSNSAEQQMINNNFNNNNNNNTNNCGNNKSTEVERTDEFVRYCWICACARTTAITSNGGMQQQHSHWGGLGRDVRVSGHKQQQLKNRQLLWQPIPQFSKKLLGAYIDGPLRCPAAAVATTAKRQLQRQPVIKRNRNGSKTHWKTTKLHKNIMTTK